MLKEKARLPFFGDYVFEEWGDTVFECYEIVSGTYIVINLLIYLDSSYWITEPNIHWIILIFPGLARKILGFLKTCGIWGEEHRPQAYPPDQ